MAADVTSTTLLVLIVCIVIAIADKRGLAPPRIVQQSDVEKAYKLGEDVQMTCVANAESRPRYSWTKNGVLFDLTASNILRVEDQEGSFVIKSPRVADEGVYQCFASNAYGTAVSGNTTLKKAVLDSFPTVTEVTVHQPTIGSHVVLNCQPPRSYPTGKVYWGISRPGVNQLKALTVDDRVVLSYEGHLYFSNVEKQDYREGDRYVCYVYNNVLGIHVQGQDQRVNPVESPGTPSYIPPTLLWNSQTRDTAIRGYNKKMKCIFGGLPTPRVTWTRIDSAGSSRFEVTSEGHGTEIEIVNVDYGDAGTYRCTATNGDGTHQPAFQDLFLDVESTPYWRQNRPPGNVEAKDEDNVELECHADGRPRPDVTWSVNGRPVAERLGDPRWQVEGNRLRIQNVSESDAAIMQCTASNVHGSILANVVLSVAATRPSFTTTPTDTKIVEGGSTVLRCSAFGAPNPHVTWLRGTPTEPVSGDGFVVQAGGNLEIRVATLNDTNTYHCQATNKFGSEMASCSLIVRRPTIISRPPVVDVIANVTDDVRIPCDVSTDPAERPNLVVEWRKDGRRIKFSGHGGHLRVDDNDFSLHIDGAQITDTAGYSCHASNGLDSATSDVTSVIIRGRPKAPTDVRVISCSTTTAELRWSVPDDNNSPIIDYIVYQVDRTATTDDSSAVEQPVEENLVIAGSAESGSFLSAFVGTRPWATYAFRVVARNAIGTSDPGSSSSDGTPAICSTPEVAPQRNPRGVCSRLERPRQLIIVWEPLPHQEHNGEDFHYRVGYRLLSGGGTSLTSTVNNPNSSKLTIHNQEIFQKYEIYVQSVNRIGEAPILANERKIGYSGEGQPLDAPRNLQLRSDTLNSTYAEFSWDSVNTSISRIQGFFRGYRIQYWRANHPRDIRSTDVIVGPPVDLCMPRTASGSSRRRRQHRSKAASGLVTGAVANLWPYSKIVAGVTVLNQGSEGRLSDTVEFMTPQGVPGVVASLDIVERGSNHLTVRWSVPIDPNGIITSYVVEYQVVPPNVGQLYRIMIMNPLQTTKRLLDLEPKTEYRVWVSATTTVGNGLSLFVDGTTLPVSDPDIPAIGFVAAGEDSANVSWSPSSRDPAVNPAGKFYVEYISSEDADLYSQAWNRSDPSPDAAAAGENWVRIANLTPGEQYYFRVVAVNGIEPDTRETRSDPPWKERIGLIFGTQDPIYGAKEEALTQSHASVGWFVILMCIIVVLLLLLMIACLVQRSRGEIYPVFEKERAWGHDPNAPEDAPFNEYVRNNEPSEAGQGSLDSDDKPIDSETDSLGEYEDQDPMKFNEDGSFIGQYTRRNPSNPATPSVPPPQPTYNTFV
jgi:receptor-type tyrosine-protein phosphatase zeta